MLIRLLTLLASVAPWALADVEFTSPAAGASVKGGSTISVQWKDSGSQPPLSDLKSYTLFLCAGGNDAASFVSTRDLQGFEVDEILGSSADDGHEPLDSISPHPASRRVQYWQFGVRHCTSERGRQ